MKKILVVGVGSIGLRHIENFSVYFDEISVVDTNPERIMQAKAKYDIASSYTDFKVAIKDDIYNAVAVTTPPHVHLPIAKLAAEIGVNLFIEKPLGISVFGWNEVAEMCKEKGLVSYVAYCYRHIPYIQKLKKIIESGRIGSVIHANMRWGSYLPDWHPWEDYRSFYMAKKEQGGGALLDESHGIDLIRYVLGEVNEVFAVIDTISDLEISSDDIALLTLRLENNVLVQINFDLSSRYPRISLEIIGTKGTIVWDRVDNVIKCYDASSQSWSNEQFSKDDLMSMYPRQARHFYECVFNGQEPVIDIDNAICTQKIIDASFESSIEGKLMHI